MAGDWIRLNRRLLDSQVFSDDFLLRLWVWCLLKANWKRGWKFGREIPPGSFATGELSAAEQLSVSGSRWRRGIAKLQEFGMIEKEATNRFTIISVVNWHKYQLSDEAPTNERRTSDEPPTNERRATDDNRRREEGEEGKTNVRERVVVPKSLDSQEFRETWELYRSWWLSNTGKRLDDIRALQQLGILRDRGSPEKAIADLKLTMASSTKPGTIWDSGRQAGRNGEPKRKRRSVAEMLED